MPLKPFLIIQLLLLYKELLQTELFHQVFNPFNLFWSRFVKMRLGRPRIVVTRFYNISMRNIILSRSQSHFNLDQFSTFLCLNPQLLAAYKRTRKKFCNCFNNFIVWFSTCYTTNPLLSFLYYHPLPPVQSDKTNHVVLSQIGDELKAFENTREAGVLKNNVCFFSDEIILITIVFYLLSLINNIQQK